MGKKKFDERKPMMAIARFYQEKLIKFSDKNYQYITNDRAKWILGRMMRLETWLQTKTINDMVELGLLEREGQQILKIVPIS
jgi:hypothetical protein